MADERYYLGVDGGGSGCRAVIASADGDVLGLGTGGPANPRGVGVAAAWRNILDAVDEALVASGCPCRPHELYACLGLAGVGRDSDRAAFLADGQPFAGLRLEPDLHVALVGALGQEQGALLVAGTGSVAYAVDSQGTRYRVGGHGFVVGDEGGGAWLGKEAVRHALRVGDGLEPSSAVAKMVLERWGPGADAVLRKVRDATPQTFGTLAPPLLSLADQDATAYTLKQAAINALVELLAVLDDRYPPGSVCFSMVGGVASALSESILERAPQRFQQGYVAAKNAPVIGALALARTTFAALPDNIPHNVPHTTDD
ncbi:MAG: BadF/BadG/BcrA/BcrD ATPase family protein [Trueperaceae bacterium]|nr:BadF/BadG/BcrA/BcrD ATPase family protein [Trueperaceae bacterium]